MLDENGEGSDSGVIAAIETAIALKNKYNIRVINLSLGRDVFESYTLDPLCQAAERAWNAGIVVVAAAGNEGRDSSLNNDGYGTITAPGNDPFVITVGAMNTRGSRDRSFAIPTSYTSRGPTAFDHVVKPDLVAPGNLIVSLYAGAFTLNRHSPSNQVTHSLYKRDGDENPSSTYFVLSGTSMAAPMVSASAALMLQQDPTLTPDQVKARLLSTAYRDLIPYSFTYDQATGQAFFLQSLTCSRLAPDSSISQPPWLPPDPRRACPVARFLRRSLSIARVTCSS